MRLLLKLTALKNQTYDMKYFHKLQGFIYNLMKNTEYKILHDKAGYKFFCFSNIYPLYEKNGIIPPIKEGENRNLLISSPDRTMIRLLNKELKSKEEINIGEMQFKIEDISLFEPKIKNNCRIISATPIIIRIPQKNYEKYNITSDKKYIYWRPEYAFDVFVKQLEENLFKKYNEFYKTKLEEFPIFEQFKFKKPTVNIVIIDQTERMLVGSIWEFWFSYLSNEQKKLLEFGIDCGFGERNSLGFGFVNVVG